MESSFFDVMLCFNKRLTIKGVPSIVSRILTDYVGNEEEDYVLLLCFEIGFHLVQAGLKLVM